MAAVQMALRLTYKDGQPPCALALGWAELSRGGQGEALGGEAQDAVWEQPGRTLESRHCDARLAAAAQGKAVSFQAVQLPGTGSGRGCADVCHDQNETATVPSSMGKFWSLAGRLAELCGLYSIVVERWDCGAVQDQAGQGDVGRAHNAESGSCKAGMAAATAGRWEGGAGLQQSVTQLCCSAWAPCSSVQLPLTSFTLSAPGGLLCHACVVMPAHGSAAPALQRRLYTPEVGGHGLTDMTHVSEPAVVAPHTSGGSTT